MAKQWTIMVYLAGDNNLEDFGRRDLAGMKAIGSTGDVQIIAEFDQMSDGTTRRYALTRDRALSEDVVAELPDTNTGDPATLLGFVRWGLAAYPAEHTALILWNHGTGWKDDDIYALARQSGLSEAELPRHSEHQACIMSSGEPVLIVKDESHEHTCLCPQLNYAATYGCRV
jgi:hypothetical protein